MSDHRYEARLTWHGSTAAGYDAYPRTHQTGPAGKHAATMSADSAFGGDRRLTNPEELLVMAASSCQLLSFLGVAARSRLDVIDYRDEAIGVMPDGGPVMSVTAIHLRPRIELAPGSRTDRLQRMVQLAHEQCFIANSLLARLTVDATFAIDGEQVATVNVHD